jgi:hypothetical protein
MAEEDRTFDPTQAEVNRAVEQGPGVGQREMDLQPNPDRQSHAVDPQNDWGEAADEGALHGADHSRRPVKTEAERGQGPRTRQANKDIVSRRM